MERENPHKPVFLLMDQREFLNQMGHRFRVTVCPNKYDISCWLHGRFGSSDAELKICYWEHTFAGGYYVKNVYKSIEESNIPDTPVYIPGEDAPYWEINVNGKDVCHIYGWQMYHFEN